jgi:hypothetical protein
MYFERLTGAQGSIIFLPHRKRFEKHLPFLVGKVVKQSNAPLTV